MGAIYGMIDILSCKGVSIKCVQDVLLVVDLVVVRVRWRLCGACAIAFCGTHAGCEGPVCVCARVCACVCVWCV